LQWKEYRKVGKKLCSLDMVARRQAFDMFEHYQSLLAEAGLQDDTDRVLELFSRINKVPSTLMRSHTSTLQSLLQTDNSSLNHSIRLPSHVLLLSQHGWRSDDEGGEESGPQGTVSSLGCAHPYDMIYADEVQDCTQGKRLALALYFLTIYNHVLTTALFHVIIVLFVQPRSAFYCWPLEAIHPGFSSLATRRRSVALYTPRTLTPLAH
jgi:hypothetical protein